MNSIIFTIIIPTFNSENTIRYTLDSIENQDFNKQSIECLIIDGGSTDQTLSIASEYSFTSVLRNEKRLPEYAKLIGFQKAKGEYIIKMDSDEAFYGVNVLSSRLKAFRNFSQSDLLVADRLKYKSVNGNKGVAGNYSNFCGDPFSYFLYKPNASVLETYSNKVVSIEADTINLLKFNNNEMHPIADGGTTTFNRKQAINMLKGKTADISFICSVSDRIIMNNGYCLCIKDDTVIHRSKSDLWTYLKKIRFRIVNNIFNIGESGFSQRSIFNKKKKYLFPLYTFSFILPLLDAIKLCFNFKDLFMIMHVFYCYYTCFLIAYYYVLKLLKIYKKNMEY